MQVNGLPELIPKADTAGVFIPSVEEIVADSCLDRQYGIVMNELAGSVLQYPEAVLSLATPLSDLGLSSPHSFDFAEH